MMAYPSKLSVNQVIKMANEVSKEINGMWVPARPMGFASIWRRFKLAWLVFTGKADALTWEGQ